MFDKDVAFMQEALAQAQIAASLGEVPVGAVIVKDGQIIAAAYNTRELAKNATRHAEITAIEKACEVIGDWRLRGCTLYVTLEPCPMCAGAIINSRIDRVVYGAKDEKAGCCGSVVNLFAMPFNHAPTLTIGVCEAECQEILQHFFEDMRKGG